MLDIRPNCENCDVDLAPDSTEACICSYECTFCRTCVDTVLKNVCPNCGGGFVERPIRPKLARRETVSLSHQPASKDRIHTRYTKQQLTAFTQLVKDIPPGER